MDVANIGPTTRFPEVLAEHLSRCGVLLVLVDGGWLAANDAYGRSRLHDPDDFVRVEIATSLARRIPIIPVLVNDARPPDPRTLPAEIAGFTDYQAMWLRQETLQADVEAILDAVQTIVGRSRRAVLLAAGAATVAVAGTVTGVAVLVNRPGQAASEASGSAGTAGPTSSTGNATSAAGGGGNGGGGGGGGGAPRTSGTTTAPNTPTVPPREALAARSDIPVGAGRTFPAANVVVTQPRSGTFNAFSATCTHQGCTVDSVNERTINCPCHGSGYSIVDGSVLTGPAPRPLTRRDITIEDGSIYLA